MEEVIRLFRKSLLEAFGDWLEKNKEAIGKWYDSIQRQSWQDCATPIEIMGTAMWMFNVIADLGVLAGIGPDRVNLVEIRQGLDEQSTKRLLLMIQSCMSLQYLPKEIATKPIPIISNRRFSLGEYVKQT
jgi:hypothetical protein